MRDPQTRPQGPVLKGAPLWLPVCISSHSTKPLATISLAVAVLGSPLSLPVLSAGGHGKESALPSQQPSRSLQARESCGAETGRRMAD